MTNKHKKIKLVIIGLQVWVMWAYHLLQNFLKKEMDKNKKKAAQKSIIKIFNGLHCFAARYINKYGQ